jgi:hypothetical protein
MNDLVTDSFSLAKKNQQIQRRKSGFAKGFFTYIAPDFDDSIPAGFEEYLADEAQLVKTISEK